MTPSGRKRKRSKGIVRAKEGAVLKKALVLTGDFGEGHKQAAQALLEASRNVSSQIRLEIRDFIAWTRPYLHHVSRFVYMQGVKHSPSLYGYMFEKTRQPGRLMEWLRRFRPVGLSRLADMINAERPDVVVSTLPMASASVSLAKAEGLLGAPLVTVITDHTDHSYWLHPCTDLYLVGSEQARQMLQRAGVPDERIAVTGIPVHPKFSFPFSKPELRKKYGLRTDVPVVIVMGGGYGLIGEDVVDLFFGERLEEKLQVLFVCGRNRRLYRKLLARLSEGALSGHDIRVFGYVSDIHELMALSDLLVTKSGGLTTSEAVTVELPMILYKPIPGQETDNAQFLTSAGAATQAHNAAELERLVRETARDPARLEAMRAAARRLQTKHSALRAVEAIVGVAERSRPQPAWERAPSLPV